MAKYNTRQIKELIIQESIKQGVDPAIMLAIAENESGFDPNAHNPRGENSFGLFQINKDAHPTYNGGFDPVVNTQWGVGIFKDALRRANGDINLALRIYNGGYGGRNSKDAKGYATRVAGLIGKHRNTTVPDSNYRTTKARGVRMANNNTKLEGQVSNTDTSPVSAKELQNLLDSISADTAIAEQKFRTNLQPSVKAWWYDYLQNNNFSAPAVQAYIANTGDAGATMLKLDWGWNENNPAPWERGGRPTQYQDIGTRQRREYERIANDQLLSDMNTLNQYYSPENVAAREQSMRDRLTGSFNRYNQMVNNLQDPRLQNGGYYIDPRDVEANIGGRIGFALAGGDPNLLPTAQQIAQARYEAQIANQYGVPYQQVADVLKDKSTMMQKLLGAQIEQDLKLEMQLARTPEERFLAQQKANDRYYKLMQQGMEKQYDIENEFNKQKYNLLQAGVAPTITGSSNIYQTGVKTQGDIATTAMENQRALQEQQLQNQATIDKANIDAQTALKVEQMRQTNPWRNAGYLGSFFTGAANVGGYNPQITGRVIGESAFGDYSFPLGAPNLSSTPSQNINNLGGGLRISPEELVRNNALQQQQMNLFNQQ